MRAAPWLAGRSSRRKSTVCGGRSSGSIPREKVAHACASRSITRTACPVSASAAARVMAVVVFATPPFWFATAMTRATRYCGGWMKERDDGHVHLGLAHGFDGRGDSPAACSGRGIDHFGRRQCRTRCFRIGHQRLGARTWHRCHHDDDHRRRRCHARRGVLGLRRFSPSAIEQRRFTGRSGLVAGREPCERLGSRQARLNVVRVGRRSVSLEVQCL